MSEPSPDTHPDDSRHSFETRVAVDVMFEAFSHIQASIDASTEDERVKSYANLKRHSTNGMSTFSRNGGRSAPM